MRLGMREATLAYPWHKQLSFDFTARLAAGSLPHAMLIVASSELGQNKFARNLAQLILCADHGEAACNTCRSCKLFAAQSHPDYYFLGLEDSAKFIKIEQVRLLTDSLCQKPHLSSKRVIIIDGADKMTTAAANALLKTLEEPASDTHFILLAAEKHKLLPTISSRAQHTNLTASVEGGVAWLQENSITPLRARMLLKIANGSPINALEIANGDFLALRSTVVDDLIDFFAANIGVIVLGAKLVTLERSDLLNILYSVFADLQKLNFSVDDDLLNYPDLADSLRVLHSHIPQDKICTMLESLNLLTNDVGANRQLQIENMLINWHKLKGA
jgi:DNA polymerase III subunit delta'